MTASQHTVTRDGSESGFARAWRFDEDGDLREGRYVRTEEGPTSYGSRPIVVVDVGGEERAVWLTTTVLLGRFQGELSRRKTRDFTVGERISISRGSEKKTSASGHDYWPFNVTFHDGPQRDAATILGGNADTAGPADEDEDGVPF